MIDLMKVLLRYRRMIVFGTASITGFVVLLGGLYYFWLQTTRWTATLGFRPTFTGAENGRYPNDLPFSPSDISSGSVLDRVFDANKVGTFCSRDEFRAGFFVEQRSPQLMLLDNEYQSRLADARLTTVDRERLQAEYSAKRAATPVAYRLVFAPAELCQRVPAGIVSKILDDVLSTWADEVESKRGVLRLRVQVLTPNIFNFSSGATESLFTKANLVRSSLNRSIASVRGVQALPGAELVRYGDKKTSFAEIELRLIDLTQARYEPLVALSNGAFGADAVRLVEEWLATANVAGRTAEARTESYRSALREYSGSQPFINSAPIRDGAPSSSMGMQNFATQLDRTFVDRLIDMSEANTMFRQEMTRLMVESSVKELESKADVVYYEKLLGSLRRTQARPVSLAEVDMRLNDIVDEAKDVMSQFNVLYDEFSRIAFKPASVMYRIEQPAFVETARPFSLQQYLFAVFAAFVLSLFGMIISAVVRDRLWHSVKPTPAPEEIPVKS